MTDQTYEEFKDKLLTSMDRKKNYIEKAEKVVRAIMETVDAEFNDLNDRASCYYSICASMSYTLMQSSTNPIKIKKSLIECIKSLPVEDKHDSEDN